MSNQTGLYDAQQAAWEAVQRFANSVGAFIASEPDGLGGGSAIGEHLRASEQLLRSVRGYLLKLVPGEGEDTLGYHMEALALHIRKQIAPAQVAEPVPDRFRQAADELCRSRPGFTHSDRTQIAKAMQFGAQMMGAEDDGEPLPW